MRAAAHERLEALRQEFEAGRQRLAELEAQHAQTAETVLRISGAIQVLEELIGDGAPAPETTNGKQTKSRAKVGIG